MLGALPIRSARGQSTRRNGECCNGWRMLDLYSAAASVTLRASPLVYALVLVLLLYRLDTDGGGSVSFCRVRYVRSSVDPVSLMVARLGVVTLCSLRAPSGHPELNQSLMSRQ